MPPNAQVIIFDDDEMRREYMREGLHDKGHTVIGEAGSIEELESLLPALTFAPDEQTVALIDNNAPWKTGEEPDSKGVGRSAEKRIIDFFKSIGQPVITVSVTLSENPQYGEHHYSLRTEPTGIIGTYVTNLPRKER